MTSIASAQSFSTPCTCDSTIFMVPDTLDATCAKLLNNLSNPFKEISDIIKLANLKHISADLLPRLNDDLIKIGKILSLNVTALCIEDMHQSKETISFLEVLNTHLFNIDAHHLDCGSSCSFHNEGLLSHSVLAMINCIWATQITSTPVVSHIAGLMGLLHDVGKQKTVTSFAKSNELCYPCHGELGCSILLRLWDCHFAEHISEEDWITICSVINIHMCGYREVEPCEKWNLLSQHPDEVKHYLEVMAYGDFFSAYPKTDDEISNFLLSRPKFHEHIFKKHSMKVQGVLVQILGGSSSGKTTFSRIFYSNLMAREIKAELVCRDTFMMKTVCSKMGWHIDQVQYDTCYKVYQEHKLNKVVNEQMNLHIEKLLNDNVVVIVDSVALLYAAATQIIPKNATNSLKISIFIDRGALISEDGKRIGVSREKQIELLGPKAFNMTFPAKSKGVNLFNLSAIATARDWSKASQVSSRPHLVLHCFWNEQTMRDTNINHYIGLIDSMIVAPTHVPEQETTSSHPGEPISTDDMDATTLLNHLGTLENINDFMDKHEYRVSDYCNKKVICIKYKDGRIQWKKAWGRLFRGNAFFWDDGEWKEIKHVLQAGAEVYTGYHETEQVNKEDMQDYDKGFNHLSKIQQETFEIFSKKKAFPKSGILTSKADGAFIVVNVYEGELATKLSTLIEQYGDEFAKIIANSSWRINEHLVVISTSGTWFPSNNTNMKNYIISSIRSSLDIAANKDTPEKVLTDILPDFLYKIKCSIKQIKEKGYNFNESISLHFEAICKNRTDDWSEYPHAELATVYQDGMFRCLGMATSKQFWSHAQIQDVISAGDWDQPFYWNVKHPKQVESMLKSLDNILKGTMTHSDFLLKFKPANKVHPHHMILDFEGFVLLIFITDAITDYNKAKTGIYYKAHKLDSKNISKLMEYPDEAATHFWAIRVVKEFYGNFKEYVPIMFDEIKVKLTQFVAENVHLLPEKASRNFEQRPISVKFKMMLNHKECDTVYDLIYDDIFYKYFPSISKINAIHLMKTAIFKEVDFSSNIDEAVKRLLEDLHFKNQFFSAYSLHVRE